MKFTAGHLKRYKEIATLLWKYGRSDLVQQMSTREEFGVEPMRERGDPDIAPAQFAADLEAMGPTYIKIGQVLAGRPDLLPAPYVEALERLQDNVRPFSFADVEKTIVAELGMGLPEAFARFDPEPLAAASLGQVHAAVLHDGRRVVVKVQRPDIRQQIAEDFEVLTEIAGFFDEHTTTGERLRLRLRTILDEFKQTIQQELDYELEAQNLVTFGINLREFPQLYVPQPVSELTTSRVLTMDFVDGWKITAIDATVRSQIDGDALAEELLRAYLKQVLIDGIFHADPHPGNVFVTADGKLALLDLGMVGRTGPGMQEFLFKLLLAVSDGHGEEAAEIVVRMSEKLPDFDAMELRRRIGHLVARHRDQGLHNIKLGQSLLQLGRDARDNGLFVPSELSLLGKTLLQLDEIGRLLDPDLNPDAMIRRNVAELMTRRLRQDLSQGNFFNLLLELKDFVSNLPSRLNRIMDAIANAEFELTVRTPEARILMAGLEKIANRVAASVVLAALIVGAALLMRVPTHFQLFGYPGLAMLFFLAAAGGGFWLVIAIFFHDRKNR